MKIRRERAVDDATRRAVESELRRYYDYRAAIEVHDERARREAALAVGYSAPRNPDDPRMSGGLPHRDALERTYAQYLRLVGEMLREDAEIERARQVVAAIDAAYRSLDARTRRVMELRYYAGAPVERVADALGYDASVIYRACRTIVAATLRALRARHVATYAPPPEGGASA